MASIRVQQVSEGDRDEIGGRVVRLSPPPACEPAGCSGTGPKPAERLPDAIHAKVREHPCYSEEAHHFYARMHVAVAWACNIQCNYCNRKYDCANESRPGVVSERLTPDRAVDKAMAVAATLPNLSVVGIAGPGDALADHRRTFATVLALRQRLPDITLCIATNGLALPDHIDSIRAHGIDHVTITINAIDPDIGAEIHPWIFFDHRRHTGRDAAVILRDRQLDGLSRLAEAGVLVKVNSVLIPGINDEHLASVHAEVMGRGAFLHNIMPLISDAAHGTHFGLTGRRGPTAAELAAVQSRMGGDARLMRHCRQCRADAVGLLGRDENQRPQPALHGGTVDAESRRAFRSVVEREQDDRQRQHQAAEELLATIGMAEPALVAVCSKGGGRVNEHFGHATEFHVYEAGPAGIRFAGVRAIERYCLGGDSDDDGLERIIATLSGVSAVLCARVGRCPSARLAEAGIAVSDAFAFAYAETAVARYLSAAAAAGRPRLTA